ncbi:hypothetical protein O181_069797 [Austropuccinia psidii MF-1]|uniref:Uncharacterized protein n=1 Tax=Austropuccinia psidii MF-1 TaxID=1389203 RepID=A0A9Q3I7M7_9BASI|nr:hypothetical protein [Austropuccinia psidii MF-1]
MPFLRRCWTIPAVSMIFWELRRDNGPRDLLEAETVGAAGTKPTELTPELAGVTCPSYPASWILRLHSNSQLEAPSSSDILTLFIKVWLYASFALASLSSSMILPTGLLKTKLLIFVLCLQHRNPEELTNLAGPRVSSKMPNGLENLPGRMKTFNQSSDIKPCATYTCSLLLQNLAPVPQRFDGLRTTAGQSLQLLEATLFLSLLLPGVHPFQLSIFTGAVQNRTSDEGTVLVT